MAMYGLTFSLYHPKGCFMNKVLYFSSSFKETKKRLIVFFCFQKMQIKKLTSYKYETIIFNIKSREEKIALPHHPPLPSSR